MITIRSYKESDYPGVKAVLEEVDLFDTIWDSKENLSGMIEKEPDAILIAVDKENIVGNIFIIPYGTKVAYLFRLAVLHNYQNHGIASQLITHAEEIFRKKGVVEFGLYVDQTNNDLQAYYKKRGFTTSKNPKPYTYIYKLCK